MTILYLYDLLYSKTLELTPKVDSVGFCGSS